jgi:hypothetical protein
MNSEEKQIIHFCEIIYENKDLFHGTDWIIKWEE